MRKQMKTEMTFTREETIRAMVIGFALGISLSGSILACVMFHLKDCVP